MNALINFDKLDVIIKPRNLLCIKRGTLKIHFAACKSLLLMPRLMHYIQIGLLIDSKCSIISFHVVIFKLFNTVINISQLLIVADHLEYEMDDIRIWREHRNTPEDPCGSVLQDWGRIGDATLGNLMEILGKIGRQDILMDMQPDRQDKWHIIE